MAATDLIFSRRGSCALATLNRPQALNAMTLEMYRLLAPALQGWKADPSLASVVLRGAGRGFCAGGDVRALYHLREHKPGPADPKTQLFTDEYRFIFAMNQSVKPFVALTHGITFGGGAGLSVNAAYRVASETTLFSMPEIFIGSIPDVGATRFFNRCPGKLGLYLALTGARIGAADAIACGLFSHLVPHARFDELTQALSGLPAVEIKTTLDRFAVEAGPQALPEIRGAIDRCFGKSSVEDIVGAVEAESAKPGSQWARDAMEAFSRASPISLKLTFHQLQLGARMDLAQSLKLEFRIIQHVLAGHDFYEGVRAVLVDKDRAPRWQCASLRDVTDAVVAQHFEPLGPRELNLDV